MHGIAWQWQSADGAMGKTPLATECVGRNPTDRGEKGRKRSLVVDGRGTPLSIAVSGANLHDSKLRDSGAPLEARRSQPGASKSLFPYPPARIR
jgi:hypothetical protein